jgi:phosphoribosylanthranilate isomerase
MFIKICGCMDPDLARFAIEQGATHIGLLFSRQSSTRAVDIARAQHIVEQVRQTKGRSVAVFADEDLSAMEEILKNVPVDMVQLHGEIPKQYVAQIPLPKIYRLQEGESIPSCLDPTRDLLLFENCIADPQGFRFFIAGGLDATNIQDAILRTQAHGVDASRGVRTRDAIQSFIRASRHPLLTKCEGRFGAFGGQYVPELLIQPLQELTLAFERISLDAELDTLLCHYAGRPTPLTEIPRFATAIGTKGRIFLKREDLLHTGAHKINHAIGQCLLAKKMGKTRIIAETGAGQHGVATATACALLGLECVIYMGETDIKRQEINVQKIRLLGAEVIPVSAGDATLKDAVNAALRDWAQSYETTHYCLGSALGPHPFPAMVAHFQRVIGVEAKAQMRERVGRAPDLCIACVGGGSNAIGLFSAFLEDGTVRLIGVEAKGAARFQNGRPGVLHGSYSFLLQNTHGQVEPTHSISAGLDYPGVGPQHSALYQSKRVTYEICSDEEALAAFQLLARCEGIIPALESAHALGFLMQIAPEISEEQIVLINLSGRGDKDVAHIASLLS